MRAKRLILTNFGPHRKLDLTLPLGLIGIFGPNGSGKTHALEAIPAVLSNDFGRFPGVKLDNINTSAGPKDESSIYLEAEHNDVDFAIYRALRPPRGTPAHSLVIGNAKPITNANEIDYAIRTTLGLNVDLLMRYVFIPQWQMFAFLTERSGDRAKAYQTLCGTGRAAEICDAIEKMMKENPDLFTEIVDTSDEWRTKVVQLQASTEEARLAYETATKEELPLDLLTAHQDTVTDWNLRQDLLRQHKAEVPKIATMAAAVDQATKAANLADGQAAVARTRVEQLQADADRARVELKSVQQIKSRLAARNKLRTQLNDATALLAKVVVPAAHELVDGLEGLKSQVADAEAEIRTDRETLRTSICPTCKQPTKSLDRQAITERIKANDAKVTEKSAVIDAIENATRHRDAALLKYERLSTTVRHVEAQLAAYADVPDEVPDEAGLQATTTAYDKAKTAADAAAKTLTTAERDLAVKTAALESQRARVADIATRGRAIVVTKEQFDMASVALAAHQTALARTTLLKARFDELLKDLTAADQALTSIVARLARGQRARMFGADLRMIREEVMHRQMLPRAVAQANLKGLEATINRMLGTFGDPFWVSAADDLSFNVHFPGEPPISAERLSGGQKMMFAFCFHQSVQNLFGADVGMMTLDEPTAGVDAANRQGLAQALSQLSSSVRGSKQVIVITHADELAPMFDHIVKIGETND